MASTPENEASISVQPGAERRRHLRIPFTAAVEVFEFKSGARVSGRTSDLGLGGCYIDTLSSFPVGAEVLVRITRGEDLFEAKAKVIYSQVGMGMGLAFISAMPKHLELFQKWLLETSSKVPASQKTSELLTTIDGEPTKNLSSKPPAKFDRSHQDMKQIPDVKNTSPSALGGKDTGKPGRAVPIRRSVAAALLVAVAIGWWVMSMEHRRTVGSSSSQAVAAIPSEPTSPIVPPPPAPATDGPSQVATTDELTSLWASKKFTFVKPVTNESVEAMVIRLPNRSLWAFALHDPHGGCDLEFVTDLNRLAKQYGYQSNHPMVVSPCNSTIYDPLKVGSIGGNVWVKGAVVQGAGLRPPISINIQVRGHSVIADQIE